MILLISYLKKSCTFFFSHTNKKKKREEDFIMYFLTTLSVILLASPIFVCSLKCYDSKQTFALDYLVTSEIVPSFASKCQLVDSAACYLSIQWNMITNTTRLDIRGFSSIPPSMAPEDTLTVSIAMQRTSAQADLSLAHHLNFLCDSADTCNGEENVRQLLRSLVIEDSFKQELSSLLETVSPFDAKAAQCFEFSNSSTLCPTTDLSSCQRCEILTNKLSPSDERICARCPKNSEPENIIARLKIFHFHNPTADSDDTILACQLKGCNSVANSKRIYEASQITFNSIFLT